MKLFVLFSILFAFVYLVQAKDVTLSFLLAHKDKSKTIGEFKGFLVGKNVKKEFSFGKMELMNLHTLVTVVDFPEEVDRILIETNSDLPKNLGFYSIGVLTNYNKNYSLFKTEKENFSRGETVAFIEIFSISKK